MTADPAEYLPVQEAGAKNTLQLPSIIDVTALVAKPFERPREIIHGLLHQGSKLVLGGGSKSFKTWSLTDLGLSVSHGEPWLSCDTEKVKVLYLNLEIQEGFFKERIEAVARAKSVTLQPGQMDVWNLRGFAAGYDILIPEIQKRIETAGYGLVIIDPIYKLYGQTDENSAKDVAGLLNQIEKLAVGANCAVAFGAHFSKGNQAGKESIDRISGSGVFARDPDSLLIFTRHEEEDAFAVESALRNFAPLEPFCVRWEYPLMKRDNALDPSRLKQPKGRPKTYDESQLLSILPESGLENKPWMDGAKTQHSIGERAFYRLRKSLEEQGRVLYSKVNGKWMPVKAKTLTK